MDTFDTLNVRLADVVAKQKAEAEKSAAAQPSGAMNPPAVRQIRTGEVETERIELMQADGLFSAAPIKTAVPPVQPPSAPAAQEEPLKPAEPPIWPPPAPIGREEPLKTAIPQTNPLPPAPEGSCTKKIELPSSQPVLVKTAQAVAETVQIDMRDAKAAPQTEETKKIELPKIAAAPETEPVVWRRPADTETVIRRVKPAAPAVRRRSAGVIVTSIVLCMTILCSALTFAMPQQTFSAAENRMLASAPAITPASFADGSFREGAERWFADHFPGRDIWLSAHNLLHTALGQRESGGVYLGKEGQLFLIPAAPDEANTKALAQAISEFAEKHPQLTHTAAIAPNAVSVQKENLPAHVKAPDQKAQISAFNDLLKGVTAVDLYTPLREQSEEYLYYFTDHHWTGLGARIAFEEIAFDMDINTAESYEIHTVSENFEGTLASKSGSHGVYDWIDMYLPDTDIAYYVYYPESGETAGSMFVREALAEKDQYTFFFGGNYPVVEIHTTADTGRRLLVFKDSYANALMQFLYPYFDEIVMVDARYFYDAIDPILNQNGITDVLYLYNADTFFQDTSLAGVLAESRDMRPAEAEETTTEAETTTEEPTTEEAEPEDMEPETAEDGYVYVDSYEGLFDGFSDEEAPEE